MKSVKKISALVVATLLFLANSASVFAVGNPVDSDLSNTAGSNSGKSHLEIYAFIVVLLIICIIAPFFENKKRPVS
jgi:hypothetical protein